MNLHVYRIIVHQFLEWPVLTEDATQYFYVHKIL